MRWARRCQASYHVPVAGFVIYKYNKNYDNNDTPHLKSTKNKNRSATLGRPAIKLLGASTSLRSTNFALSSTLVPKTPGCSVCVEDSYLINALS